MPEYSLVFSGPVAGREEEYHRWYDTVHLPDVLRVPGVAAGQRFAIRPLPGRAAALLPFLALVEFDDAKAARATIAARNGTPLMAKSEAMDRTEGPRSCTMLHQSGAISGNAAAYLLALVEDTAAELPAGGERLVMKANPALPGHPTLRQSQALLIALASEAEAGRLAGLFDGAQATLAVAVPLTLRMPGTVSQ